MDVFQYLSGIATNFIGQLLIVCGKLVFVSCWLEGCFHGKIMRLRFIYINQLKWREGESTALLIARLALFT